MSIQKATSLAEEALDLAWDGELPVDPKQLAEDLLVRNFSDPSKEKIPVVVRGRSAQRLDGCSGQAQLAWDDDGYYYLCEYNLEEVSYRNRFTIAHELAHVLLGHVREGRAPKRDTNFKNYDPDETDANAFAASLLMPAHLVKRLYKSARNVQELADAFGVSSMAMSYRLQNLGLV